MLTGSDASDEDDDGAASESETQPRGEGELDVSTPTVTGAESGGGGAVCPAVVLHGEPLTDRKSTFQAHAAQVNTTEQVSFQLSFLHAAGRLRMGHWYSISHHL